ncbi:SIMPL domain-containing protein [Luteibacter sp.]|uniref:SIMPL domain-containing protein n=1 Tax=Luteibacter sp. TaxID=1886636 RepID=UPI003F820510
MLAFAQTAPHIDVAGHAERHVQPDRFSINIRVEASDPKPAKARLRVEEQMAKVMAGFRANHALPESIDASTFSIGPHSIYVDDRMTNDGSEVTRTASATFARLEDLRHFIDGLDTAGEELQIVGTSVSRSDANTIDSELREEAMRDTQRKAERIAKAYGVKLGGLYTVSDQPARNNRYDDEGIMGFAAAPNKAPPIDLTVGSLKKESSIYATFLLDTAKP